jgi:hypothetical protein
MLTRAETARMTMCLLRLYKLRGGDVDAGDCNGSDAR